MPSSLFAYLPRPKDTHTCISEVPKHQVSPHLALIGEGTTWDPLLHTLPPVKQSHRHTVGAQPMLSALKMTVKQVSLHFMEN